MGKTYTQSSTLSCYFKTFFVIFYIVMFPFFLIVISILVHTKYSTLYFVILTEDDRSFCRNMSFKKVCGFF